MTNPNMPAPDLVEEIRRLKERVRVLENSSQLENSSFQEPGKIRYFDVDGNVRAVIGELLTDEGGTSVGLGLLIQRADATDIFAAYSGQTAIGYGDGEHAIVVIDDQVQIRDVQGNVPFITRLGDVGLNRPKLQWFMAPLQLLSQMVTVTSGTYGTTHSGYLLRAAKNATVLFRIITDAGTSADVRIIDRTNGDDVLASDSFGGGTDTFASLTGEQNGAIGNGLARLELQARRTAGAGNVYVQVTGCYQD